MTWKKSTNSGTEEKKEDISPTQKCSDCFYNPTLLRANLTLGSPSETKIEIDTVTLESVPSSDCR